MKKKLCKNKRQRSLFRVTLYSDEYGFNAYCSINNCTNEVVNC
jgi:hypothetical protein